MEQYGFFEAQQGAYTITKLPKAGLYEYIYKNDGLLLKVDQFGLQTVQLKPPVGEALFKREKREIGSPVTVYLDTGAGAVHTFDVFHADELCIAYTPEKATYSLRFGAMKVTTDVFVAVTGSRFVMRTTVENTGEQELCVRVMPCAFPYVNALLMAPWDKPEWYTKTQWLAEHSAFQTTRYSVSGKREERRYFTCVCSPAIEEFELSSERLVSATGNFSRLPNAFYGETENVLYTFEQCFAGLLQWTLGAGEKRTLTLCFACDEREEDVAQTLISSKELFCEKRVERELVALREKYKSLFAKRTVATGDEQFNRFINGFLPLELDWVSALDRGWPTGMRGVRDAANDFQGFLAYDQELCRSVAANIFSKQRSDGWYPRQVPFGDSDKFDLRHFVDSACFFTEFVYDYLAFTGDDSLLDEVFPYYDSDKRDSGLHHLIAGVEYLMNPDNLGEHGLVKMQGGDWLDSLSSAGIEGRGETVMVSCQLVMSIRYLVEILTKKGLPVPDRYAQFIQTMTETINAVAFNDEGFYNGVFTDRGEWIFSKNDPDGERRVYAPTNSYAIISGVAEGKEEQVLAQIKGLRGDNGYQLFSVPLGIRSIPGIGKMGTGDFLPYFAENASVYNHGSQCFLLRALARVGDHETFEDVLNYALPIDETRHAPDALCGAPYAITNCYHLVPSFRGRTGFSFLTGSVAMLARAVYSWMFGVYFTLDTITLKPCLPRRYGNATVRFSYGETELTIVYEGYGARIAEASIDGETLAVEDGAVTFAKSRLQGKSQATIRIKMQDE